MLVNLRRAGPRVRRSLAACVCLLTAAAMTFVAVATAAPVDGARAIAFLNQQRAANHIPAVRVDQGLAAWCPDERADVSSRAISRDLSTATTWSPTMSPWDNAPLHQFSMYAPAYAGAGELNHDGASCLGLGGLSAPPSAHRFYAFIADGGPADVPTHEYVRGERPWAPQQLVGIPQGRTTGPQPLLYARGMGDVRAVSWSLTASDGAPLHDVRLADATSSGGARLSGGGVMVPPPLAPATTYRGSVLWQGAHGVTDTQRFTFTTAPRLNFVSLGGVGEGAGASRIRHLLLRVDSYADHPLVTLRGPSGQQLTPTLHTAHGQYQAVLVLASGSWRACVRSGGSGTKYARAVKCVTFVTSLRASSVTAKSLARWPPSGPALGRRSGPFPIRPA